MRHGKRGRKLGRTASHKKAMFNNLATSLFVNGKVRTTLPKAKELRGVAERLISFARRGDLHARRQVLRRIQNKVVLTKLFEEIAPSFADRSGGYTRILKLGPRRGDSSELCLIELVVDDAISESDVEETESDTSSDVEDKAEESEAVAETSDSKEEKKDA